MTRPADPLPAARVLAVVVLAALFLASCSVDFVAVADRTEIHLRLASSHEAAGLRASVWSVSEGPVPVRLVVDGREVEPVDALFGRFTYRTELAVDSLEPEVRVEIEVVGGESVGLAVPMLARAGSPSWLTTGELSIPVSFGDGFDSVESVSWSAVVLSSDRGPIAAIPRQPLSDPDRILVPDSLLPDRAAFLSLDCRGTLPGRLQPFPVTATFTSAAEVAVPPVVMAAAGDTE